MNTVVPSEMANVSNNAIESNESKLYQNVNIYIINNKFIRLMKKI